MLIPTFLCLFALVAGGLGSFIPSLPKQHRYTWHDIGESFPILTDVGVIVVPRSPFSIDVFMSSANALNYSVDFHTAQLVDSDNVPVSSPVEFRSLAEGAFQTSKIGNRLCFFQSPPSASAWSSCLVLNGTDAGVGDGIGGVVMEVNLPFSAVSPAARRALVAATVTSTAGKFSNTQDLNCNNIGAQWVTYPETVTVSFDAVDNSTKVLVMKPPTVNFTSPLQGNAAAISLVVEVKPDQQCPGWPMLSGIFAAATVLLVGVSALVNRKLICKSKKKESLDEEESEAASLKTRAKPYEGEGDVGEQTQLLSSGGSDEGEGKNKKRGLSSICSKAALLVSLYTVILILSRSIDFVLYVRMAYKMKNYEWFLSQILLSFFYCVVLWPVTWIKMYATNHITKEMRSVPLRKFFIMGMLDSIGNLLSTIPAPFLSGALNVVIPQGIIFVNMLLSLIFLKTRYKLTHIAAAIVVFLGIVIAVYPKMCDGGGSQFYWIALLFISNVPQAASNVYKEYALKAYDLDVFYVNSWVALFQLLFGILLAPTVFVPILSGASAADTLKPAEFGQYLKESILCFAGISSKPGDICGCKDGPVYLVFIVFIGFNITFNIAYLLVFKYGSATLAVVAGAVRLALSDFGFSIPFVAGEAYALLQATDVIALVFLLLGVVWYRVLPETTKQKKGENAAAEEPEPVDGHPAGRGSVSAFGSSHPGSRRDSVQNPPPTLFWGAWEGGKVCHIQNTVFRILCF
uniref:Uncharacterized protein n=1 Tax=Palpitomonas bilix TaxID=652834 RepID=A0A7S3G041_9EUKA|mmetsp:Transcript_10868/g.28529  ORF Transcript_10868/g.28529 Transcript_10868/m.28529 type:complete len:743 (+) Transcript_10868:224-2452(+)